MIILFDLAPVFLTIAIIGLHYGLVNRMPAIGIVSTVASFFNISVVVIYWKVITGF